MTIIETIQVPTWLTWQRFGAPNKAYFETCIQSKDLRIMSKYRNILTLQDENGEVWYVHQSDLIEDKKLADNESYPWREQIPSWEISQENARIREEGRQVVLEKCIIKDRLRIQLIQLTRRAFELGYISHKELEFWEAYTRFSLEDDLKKSIEIFQNLETKAA